MFASSSLQRVVVAPPCDHSRLTPSPLLPPRRRRHYTHAGLPLSPRLPHSIGAVWGLGHGFSATMIGLAAFFLKDRLSVGSSGGAKWVSKLGTYTEVLVGVSLITIGLIGEHTSQLL
jgi:hypothetical protein